MVMVLGSFLCCVFLGSPLVIRDNFVKKFKAQFVDPNPKATAARKLFALKQEQEDIQTYLTKVIPIIREADLGLVATKEII